MGSNNSSQKSSDMNKYITNHQKISATSEKVFSTPSNATPVTKSEVKPPLRSILKNKQVKYVELYVQNGKEWRVERYLT